MIQRKRESVGLVEVARQQRQIPGLGVEAVDAGEIEFRLPGHCHGTAAATEGGIGEIHHAVLAHDDVVGAVQFLAIVVARYHDHAAVVLGPRNPARRVFAGQDAAVVVVGIAVGHVARLPEHRDAVRLGPPMHSVAGDVAEREVLLHGVPDRPFRETEPLGEGLERKVARDDG